MLKVLKESFEASEWMLLSKSTPIQVKGLLFELQFELCWHTKNLKAEDSTAKSTLDDYTYIFSPV